MCKKCLTNIVLKQERVGKDRTETLTQREHLYVLPEQASLAPSYVSQSNFLFSSWVSGVRSSCIRGLCLHTPLTYPAAAGQVIISNIKMSKIKMRLQSEEDSGYAWRRWTKEERRKDRNVWGEDMMMIKWLLVIRCWSSWFKKIRLGLEVDECQYLGEEQNVPVGHQPEWIGGAEARGNQVRVSQ